MKTRRDELSNLMYSTLTTMPDAGLTEKCDALATIALAHAHLAGADDRLAARHQALREKALTRALGRAIGLIELIDLDAAIEIADTLTESLEPLVGEQIRLGGLKLNCGDHVVLFPVLAGTLGEFAEKLVDYFSRQHHEPRLARERAEGVVELLREHLSA